MSLHSDLIQILSTMSDRQLAARHTALDLERKG